MLWKLIILHELKNDLSKPLLILSLPIGSGLNTIDESTRNQLLSAERFMCVNERLLDGFNQAKNWSTYETLSENKLAAFLNHLGKLVMRDFWRDLGLPYPGFVQRTHEFKHPASNSLSTFEQANRVFNNLMEEFNQPIYMDKDERLLLIRNLCLRNCFYKVVDIVGYCLALSELWKGKTRLTEFSKHVTQLYLHIVRAYKYSIVVKRAISDNNSDFLNALPYDSLENDSLCLSELLKWDEEIDRMLEDIVRVKNNSVKNIQGENNGILES
jgi:hypothetical protein